MAPHPAPAMTSDGVPVHVVRSFCVPGMGVDVGYASTSTLRGLLKDLDPDVVHLASPLILGYQAMRACSLVHIPTVAVFQTDISGFARHYRLAGLGALSDAVLRRIHAGADLNLVPSTSSQAYLLELGVDRVALWGRGVDSDQFDPRHRSPDLRTRWLTPDPERTIVGYVGRLAPEKRVAALRTVAGDPRIRMVIIGDGPQRIELQRLLPQAHFTGLLKGSDLGTAVASLDLLIAPGERETFCQVIQEGMASGLPIIAPDVGGPRDLVVHGEVGLRYRPGDNEHLAQCVDALVSSPAARAVMGIAARAMIRDRTWTRIGDQLIEHYRSVAHKREPALAA